MNLERFENGKVVEHFSYPDLLGLLRQLGLA
jgi:predicted ester cyclase